MAEHVFIHCGFLLSNKVVSIRILLSNSEHSHSHSFRSGPFEIVTGVSLALLVGWTLHAAPITLLALSFVFLSLAWLAWPYFHC